MMATLMSDYRLSTTVSAASCVVHFVALYAGSASSNSDFSTL